MGRPANILLIDDDLGVRQALEAALTDENYRVTLAANAPEADHHLQQRGEGAVDAVLLDLCLGPDSGWHLFDRLKTLNPHLPVIIMTASRGQIAPNRVAQCVATMEKPLNLRLLFETLRQVTTAGDPIPQPIASDALESRGRTAA